MPACMCVSVFICVHASVIVDVHDASDISYFYVMLALSILQNSMICTLCWELELI